MNVSIVVPVFNEEAFVEKTIERVLESPLKKMGLGREVIVVDDSSTDRTYSILKRIQEVHPIKLIRHEENRGKGAALATGFAAVTGEVVIIQDADLEYDPAEYDNLLRPILDGRADVVYGSRFSGMGPHRVLYFWHYLANRTLTLLSNMFTDLNLTDMETCYKVFRSEVLKSVTIEESRFGFEPEITAKIAKLARQDNYRIYEIGISYSGRTYAEGKKITWKDGVRAFWCILKYNLLR